MSHSFFFYCGVCDSSVIKEGMQYTYLEKKYLIKLL